MSPSDQLASPRCMRSGWPSPEMSAYVYWNTSDVWLTPSSLSKSRAASGSQKSTTSASPGPARASGCRVPAERPALRLPAAAVGRDLVVAVGELPVRPAEPPLADRHQ